MRIYHGRLTDRAIVPYLLQDVGIEFYLLTLAYICSIFFRSRAKIVTKIKIMRITLFQAFFIDYTLLSLRTLGHFPL